MHNGTDDPSPDEPSAEITGHIIRQLDDGIPPSELVRELTELGLAEADAEGLVERVRETQGLAPPREPDAPIQTVLRVAGYLAILVGIVLWIGNIVGFLRTFPLAGFVTIVLGCGLLSIRIRRDPSGDEIAEDSSPHARDRSP